MNAFDRVDYKDDVSPSDRGVAFNLHVVLGEARDLLAEERFQLLDRNFDRVQ